MRSRRTSQDEMAAIARRRLDLVSAELAGLRGGGPVEGPHTQVGSEAPDEADAAGDAGVAPGDTRVADDGRVEGAGAPGQLPRADTDTHAVGGSVPAPGRPGRHARRPVGRGRRAAAWVHDRLPPTLQGRVHLGAAHLTVVALMVATGLAVTSWWVLRAEGQVTVVPARAESPARPPQTPAPALVTSAPSAKPTADATAVVVVDVAGKVRRPGIATLPVGARVVDALEAAGGVRRGVDLASLNLARVLVDGEQVVVGIPVPGGVAAPAASASGTQPGTSGGVLVNINTATQTQLEELPGVGPVTAAAILQWRTDHGPFTSVDELMEVSGIGEATLAEMAPFVTL